MENWLEGWAYRKVCAVSREGGDLEKHWMKILVGKSESYRDADVHCGGKCLDTFTDIRFTKEDGVTPVPYKVLTVGGGVAEAWVRLPLITDKPTHFYLYYGNPKATQEAEKPVFLWEDLEL